MSQITVTLEVTHASDDPDAVADWIGRIAEQWLVGCSSLKFDGRVRCVVGATALPESTE